MHGNLWEAAISFAHHLNFYPMQMVVTFLHCEKSNPKTLVQRKATERCSSAAIMLKKS
jgi:hypothetical protein